MTTGTALFLIFVLWMLIKHPGFRKVALIGAAVVAVLGGAFTWRMVYVSNHPEIFDPAVALSPTDPDCVDPPPTGTWADQLPNWHPQGCPSAGKSDKLIVSR
jgi:hypothetical protein